MSGFERLAQLLSLQIVNCFVLGIAVAALAGVASVVLGRRSAGLRFVIWFAGLVALTSPFLIFKPIASLAGRAYIPERSLRPEWALYIFCAWAFVSAIGLLRVARGLWRIHRLKASCHPLDEVLEASIRANLRGMTRKFSIHNSEGLRVPVALGFFRPVIALPTWSVGELSEEELNTVVLHEAAHLERWDDWTNLLQKIIRAVLFFHPAVWWIDSRLSLEREMSCDDMVLVNARSPRHYAACLISLAEKTLAHHRPLALVQAAVSQLTHTALRISKILDGNRRTAKPLVKPAMAALAAFLGLSFLALEHTPQLVNFTTSTPTSTIASPSPDKFDYVANLNPPAGKAVLASLDQVNPPVRTRAKIEARSQARSGERGAVEVNKRPAVTEEASAQEDTPVPVVNAAMNKTELLPSFVYLVTETEQYDSFGNLAITTAVWRIRVITRAPRQTAIPLFPKRT